jgi:hypothetical protein
VRLTNGQVLTATVDLPDTVDLHTALRRWLGHRGFDPMMVWAHPDGPVAFRWDTVATVELTAGLPNGAWYQLDPYEFTGVPPAGG